MFNKSKFQFSQQKVVIIAAVVIALIIAIVCSFLMYSSSSSSSSESSSISASSLSRHHEIHVLKPHLPNKIAEAHRHHVHDSTTNNDAHNNHQKNDLRIAVSVLLTSNSKRGEQINRAIDGLAVLRRSILEVLPLKDQKQFSFVAILTESVDEKWEKILITRLGWSVKRYMTPPVNAAEIKNRQIGKEIVTDGAIGVDELTKLRVFEWGDEFDIVLLLDADIMFHKPFPELYKRLTDKALRWTKGGWAIEKMNGGFLVVEPKAAIGKNHFEEIMNIIKEGDFRPGTGWRGSGIGWCYGGRTVQGVLPYYFLRYLRKDKKVVDDSELERCRYNNMDQLPECKKKSVEEITSNHFTGDCVKPWWCATNRSPRCSSWAKKWKEVYFREVKAQKKADKITDSYSGCDFGSLAKELYETL